MKPAPTRIPVVCDLSGAPDTPTERVDSYRRLFTDALVARERTIAGIRFRFRNDPGIETRVRDIATLEQQCCAFFSFITTATGGEVLLDVSSTDDETARAVLDEFYNLPEHVALDTATLQATYQGAGLTFAIDPAMMTTSPRTNP